MNNNPQDRPDDLKQNPSPDPQEEQRQVSAQQPAPPQKETRTEIPKSDAPKSNVPDYGDKPEQAPQAEGQVKKQEKSIS